MQKKWIEELARDLIALAGIPFFVITIVRVSVLSPYYPMQFIISSGLFFILRVVFKADLRAGIGLILVVFTSMFYNHWLFTSFAILLYIGIVVSLFYFKITKRQIFKGILLGGISASIGYFIVRLIFF
jgi:hypothetical protein